MGNNGEKSDGAGGSSRTLILEGLDEQTLDEMWGDFPESWGEFRLADDDGFLMDLGADGEPLFMCAIEGEGTEALRIITEGDRLTIHAGGTSLVDQDGLLAVNLADGGGYVLDYTDPNRIHYDFLDLDRLGGFDPAREEPDFLARVGELVEIRDFAARQEGLTHTWAQIGGPGVELSGADSPVPSFTVPPEAAGQDLLFELVLSGATGVSVFSCRVRVTP